ncbi:MAG: peptidoglycan DD-metalloendopeptidase family protein [Acidimicrobiia bacterium]|nr:peptidoglycan DD-metalloendopeptidase family protein [Acidimicrobiia bacterium]
MSWQLVARAATHLAKRKLADKLAEHNNGSLLWRIVITLGLVTAPMGLVLLLVMVLGVAAMVVGSPAAAASGALGIPPVVFSTYVAAETNAPSIASGCVVDWPVIAGIWKVESNHATTGGRTVGSDGQVTPPLYGVTLDGSQPGTAVIPDSDGGLLDGDPTWDRAVGPAQFLPGSWRAFGRDGNNDGTADPQNVFDAALGTVAHLCIASAGDYTNPTDLARALRRYNNSAEYVTTVTRWIDYYRAFQFTQGAVTADELYAFPLPVSAVTVDEIRRNHHDYPASDLGVPEGTPVYAAHPGTISNVYEPCPTCRCGWGITIAGLDNHSYTYCHGTQVTVEPGTEVTAGHLIMTSGNTGNSSGPHLHFQIRNPDGALLCPQGPLEAWWNGIGLSPASAPTSGCTH